MCRLVNSAAPSYPIRAAILLRVAATVVAASCGIVDPRRPIVTTEPATAGTILPTRQEAVHVAFSEAPIRLDAERAFSVLSPDGQLDGDFSWHDAGFSWRPLSPWDPCVRYRLILTGAIRMTSGREAVPGIDVPFYALRSTGAPALASAWPADGSSVGVASDGGKALELRFSEPMDRSAVESSLHIQPALERSYAWDEAGAVLAVMTMKPLSPCVDYRWTLSREARAADGAPLSRSERGGFITDLDSAPPLVEEAYPAILSGGAWVRAAPSLWSLDNGHAIAVAFSEDVKPASLRSSIRLEPGPPGRVDAVSGRLAVFIPERAFTPARELSLVVSAEVEDISGLKMVADHRVRFTPATPYLRLLSVTTSDGESWVERDAGPDGNVSDDPVGGSVLAATIGPEPEGLLTLILGFSAPFDAGAKASSIERLSLAAFFPGSLPSPSLRSVCWVSDDTASITWEGLTKGVETVAHYYKLVVRGGATGLVAKDGLYLETDRALYLEARR